LPAGSGGAVLAGEGRFSTTPEGAIRAGWTAVADKDGTMSEAFVGTTIQTADLAGGAIALDARVVDVPAAKGGRPRLFQGRVSRLVATAPGGRVLLDAAFDRPTEVLVQDDRFYGTANVVLRFFFAIGRVEAGREYAVGGTFAADGAPLALAVGRPVRIAAGGDWIPFRYDPWIEPGSALDFTGVVPHHEPAGAFGRVVVAGDHFEFADLPGVPQRFYGVNVCGTANLPDTPEQAERFAANLARIGYNSIRLHHHEKWLVRKDGALPKAGSPGAEPPSSFDDTVPDPAQMEKFDLLVAACAKHGIYVTTDLYVSRAHVIPWRAIGIDRDGPVPADKYKLYCAFWEPACSNLCAWSRNFLLHVNPHTGRSLAEEPALATLALVNEGNLGNWGASALRDVPGVADAWRAWLAERRSAPKDGDSFDWDSVQEEIPSALYAADGATPVNRHAAAFAIFLADREAALFARLLDFVRGELGCAAPLSSLSSWYDPLPYALARREFDYVDSHFYVDHPQFLDTPWRLPSTCPNSNPVLRPAAGASSVLYKRLVDKPLCVTEFNYCGPGRYRGVGGIAAGAVGALQDWSGLWRFAWSHSRGGIVSPGGPTGYFDVANDPLAIAAERASLCLFLRGDLSPLEAAEPLVIAEDEIRDPRNGAPNVSYVGNPDRVWDARLGVATVSRDDAAARRERPPREEPAAPVGRRSVSVSGDGAFLLDTPLTAGGLSTDFALRTAGPLRFALTPANDEGAADPGPPPPATIWVSSLDGAPVAASSHLLLTHLTDVQNSGIEYADEDCTILLRWGSRPHLMRNGAARIELALDAEQGGRPPSVAVYRLDSAGRRIAEVPAEVVMPEEGAPDPLRLQFTARTGYDPDAATYLYEIVRE
ncbi:MAG: hypothetical protein IJ678_01545, partial [Kiritimatiellae bacterium]|nr:hypothetical protein [Kiritimatiellia bacterium]